MHESHLPWMRCPYSATCCWSCWLWLCIRESFQFSISGSYYLSCLQTKPLLSEVFLSAAGTNWHTSLVHKSQTAVNNDFSFFFFPKKQGGGDEHSLSVTSLLFEIHFTQLYPILIILTMFFIFCILRLWHLRALLTQERLSLQGLPIPS